MTVAANDRSNSATIVAKVLEGDDLDALLSDANPAVRETCYGTLRRLPSLRAHVAQFLNKPLRPGDADIEAILLVGAYQLCCMSEPDYAVVNDCVNAATRRGKPWAKGLINAVLRKCAGSTLEQDERSFDHSKWLLAAIKTNYPDDWRDVAQANNSRAPMWLRVNGLRGSNADYRAALDAAGIGHSAGEFPESIRLDSSVPALRLPGFSDGLVSIQDHGAQAVARAVADAIVQSGKTDSDDGAIRILDACAAPGGKAFHLHELLNQQPLCTSESHVSALELSPERMTHMRGQAKRLGHEAGLIWLTGDATGQGWHQGDAFDWILCDAPCSGTGTLRRHPDIKVRRRRADVTRSAQLQGALLDNLWRLLKPGATLVYCTCSLLREENDAVIKSFLKRLNRHGNEDASADSQPAAGAGLAAEVLPIKLAWGRATKLGWQTLPGEQGGDGFYVAAIRRGT
ncbi:MAG: 16S rRNA (cytosine(967)-C(5))-methyltransferase RsmB [Pseudomonadaceae bacterium]|nr:16S rRNA (cytosine(967)-C(5))-methyltransferase RsmB [Pseudomonadaceae bacterium]